MDAYISLMNDFAQDKKARIMKYDERNFGITAPILQWGRDYLLKIQDQSKYINKELNERRPNITNELLMSIKEIKRAQKSYRESRIILSNFKLKVRDDYIESLEDLNNIDIPEDIKNLVIQGFKEGSKKGFKKFLEMTDLEEEKIIEIDNLFNFMISRKGQYQANKIIITLKRKKIHVFCTEYVSRIKEIEERQNIIYHDKVKKGILENIKYVNDLGQKLKKVP